MDSSNFTKNYIRRGKPWLFVLSVVVHLTEGASKVKQCVCPTHPDTNMFLFLWFHSGSIVVSFSWYHDLSKQDFLWLLSWSPWDKWDGNIYRHFLCCWCKFAPTVCCQCCFSHARALLGSTDRTVPPSRAATVHYGEILCPCACVCVDVRKWCVGQAGKTLNPQWNVKMLLRFSTSPTAKSLLLLLLCWPLWINSAGTADEGNAFVLLQNIFLFSFKNDHC